MKKRKNIPIEQNLNMSSYNQPGWLSVALWLIREQNLNSLLSVVREEQRNEQGSDTAIVSIDRMLCYILILM